MTSTLRILSAVLLATVASLTGDALAGAPRAGGTLTLTLENDLFYDVDRHYTNGVRLIWVPERGAAPPRWGARFARLVPWFPDAGGLRHGYAIGQSMFTPADIREPDPPAGERPYAGWLYGTVGLGVASGSQLDQLTVTVGMIGPASLAEQSQKFIHRIVDTDEPRGWDTQLRNEPGVVLTYQRSWRRFAAQTPSGARFDIAAHAGFALGNIFTYGNAGVTARWGPRLPADYGPPRIQPGLPGSADFAPQRDFAWYLFAGTEGRVVARNIFLDGNTFRDSRSVERENLVGDIQFGVVVDWRSIRLSYTHVLRTREFRTQDGNDDFGALSIAFKL